MCERLLRQSVCLHSQSPPQKLCVDDESLDSLVLVRTGAAINEGASQPPRILSCLVGGRLKQRMVYFTKVRHLFAFSTRLTLIPSLDVNFALFRTQRHMGFSQNFSSSLFFPMMLVERLSFSRNFSCRLLFLIGYLHFFRTNSVQLTLIC